jgi:hypothetical protein
MNLATSIALLVVTSVLAASPGTQAQQQIQGPATPSPAIADKKPSKPEVVDREKKLVLKNGTFQLVREYQRTGERVRYFSAERGDWEEIPAAMVDWDATAKSAAATAKEQEALLKEVHRVQEEQRAEAPIGVDASLPVAPGIFLPAGEGMFVVEGKSVTPLNQVGADIRTDKRQVLKQVLSPVPIVPSKQNIEIPGRTAVRRVNSERPEFYLREAPPDPDQVTPIRKSSRPGEYGPEVELVRLTVKGGKRQIESIRSLFGQQISEDRNSVTVQRWDVAKDVYRFTLGQDLPAGEYAFVEILPDGVNLYVWDFGVDQKARAAATKEK